MRSGRRCRRHSQSPRAARSRRERSERASERWEAGSAEGAPGRCLRSGRSLPSSGAGEEQEANQESTSGAGRARGGGASPTPPPPVQAGERSLTAPPARSPSPWSRLSQGWSKSLRGARCSAPLPGSPPPTDRSRLRAPPAQAGEVSCCAPLSARASGRVKRRRRSAGTMHWGWGSRCCRPGRRDLLCVLALLAGCLLPVCRTRIYTNHWAVKIAGGFPEADRIASKYGFINVGQVTNPRWHRL